MRLEFDAESHAYTAGQRRVPSVTQILEPFQNFDKVAPDVLRRAQEFGTAVHKACELENQGTLDEETVTDDIAEYLDGYRLFLRESGAAVIDSEVRVFHEKQWYAGTCDLVLFWRDAYWIADIKTGAVPKTVGAQLAAYRYAYLNNTGRNCLRLCISLRRRAYQLHELRQNQDWAFFKAARHCHHHITGE